MRAVRSVSAFGTALFVACGAGESATTDASSVTAAGFTPDLTATAQHLVAATRVKEGDLVLITGSGRDAILMENLAVEVQKLGGHALISLGGDRLVRKSYDEVPAQYDAVEPEWGRLLNSNVDVAIAVDPVEELDVLAGVDPARIQARAKSGAELVTLAARRNVRQLEVGNGLYPTAERANQFGMDQGELARSFWTAVNADAAGLAATGARLRAGLSAAREVHLTHSNGTDLRFGLDRQVFVNDGVLSDADVAAGGSSVAKYVPAGEVYVRVAPGSATGHLVVDEYFYLSSPVRGLTMDLQGGRITSISAASGGEALLAAYNSASGDGRDLLTILDIGINPALSAAPGSRLLTWVPAGMVTLVFGIDFWAGGTNAAAFAMTAFLPGMTLALDGQPVVENGVLRQ